MRIFILEDDPERMKWFRERLYLDHEVDSADSCAQFDKFQPPYDLILLDHDLGGRQMEAHEDSGTMWAELMRKSSIHFNAPIIIHSYNGPAADGMKVILGDHPTIIAPFRGPKFCNILDRILGDGTNSNILSPLL